MPRWILAAVVLLGLALVAVVVASLVTKVVRRRRRGVAGGRTARVVTLGRLAARLSTSHLGARLRRRFAGKERRARLDEARRQADAALVARTMGEMRGAVMKLGQMVSFISEDVPAEYQSALASLQAQAPPMDFPLLRDVAERELGRPLERAFARFDATPLASASIGQVHRATLPTGEEVAVKVQVPGVAEAIRADLANVGLLYQMMAMFYPAHDPRPVVDELRERIGEELDYRAEARNQRLLGSIYAGHPFIRVPAVFASHSTGRVLTSEFVGARRFGEILAAPQAVRDRYGEIIYRFVFGSILRFGIFNGDPHPGNYLFEPGNGDGDGDRARVVFLDFGCVKVFPDAMLAGWRQLVAHHLRGERDAFRATAVSLGFLKEDAPVDRDLLYDYFAYFYEPIAEDRAWTFSRPYNARSLAMVFKPEGRFAGLEKRLNMPRDFVFVNRIQWGVYSILAHLGATANWHRIHHELLFGDPPSTELGRRDAEHHARWLAARALGGAPLAPGDLRRRVEAELAVAAPAPPEVRSHA